MDKHEILPPAELFLAEKWTPARSGAVFDTVGPTEGPANVAEQVVELTTNVSTADPLVDGAG
jgi:hypothetical protein